MTHILYEYENPDSEFWRTDGIYFATADGFIKIGHTAKPTARRKSLRGLGGGKVSDFLFVPAQFGKPGKQWESELHSMFAKHRVSGEWFEAVPELLKLRDQFRPQAEQWMEQARSDYRHRFSNLIAQNVIGLQ